MNKTDIRNTAIDIVVQRQQSYWSWRREEEDEHDWVMTKGQRKMLEDSQNWERDIKREYWILINKKQSKKIDLNNLIDKSNDKKWFCHLWERGRFVLKEEITQEMIEREEEWWIEYSEFLHDNK